MSKWFRHRMVARRRLVAAAALFLLLLPVACGDNGTGPSGSSGPQVVGCNSVTYQGATYSNLGCAPGVASFTVTTNQGGQTACFNITCSGGCVSSARVCGQ